MTVVLEARELGRTYVGGDGLPIPVLHGLDLDVDRGEALGIYTISPDRKTAVTERIIPTRLGFIANDSDRAKLLNAQVRDAIVRAIATTTIAHVGAA